MFTRLQVNKSKTEVHKQEGGCTKHFCGVSVAIIVHIRTNTHMLHQNLSDAF